jgi:hypothetical protein
VTEALKKQVVRITHSVQLPMVLGGVFAGAAIVFGARWMLSGQWGSPLADGLAISIVMLCVFARFRD